MAKKIGQETVEIVDQILKDVKAGRIKGEELGRLIAVVQLRLKADAIELAKERNEIERNKVRVTAYNAATKAKTEDRLREKELDQKELVRTVDTILIEDQRSK